MITLLLAMICGGIALTQFYSSPAQVTLRWLRLGALISLSLIGASLTAEILTQQVTIEMIIASSLIILFQGCHLMAVQLAKRQLQRGLALAVFLVVIVYSACKLLDIRLEAIEGAFEAAGYEYTTDGQEVTTGFSVSWLEWVGMISAATFMPSLVGGYLMSMLLGHAYLSSAGEMTQQPFRRLVVLLMILLGIRCIISLLSALLPYFFEGLIPWRLELVDLASDSGSRMWNGVMLLARYLVGFIVPLIFTWMVDDCVRRRSNQSATGILYVASVLVLVGEGIGLALLGAIGLPF